MYSSVYLYDPLDDGLYYVCGTRFFGMRDDLPERCKTCVRLIGIRTYPSYGASRSEYCRGYLQRKET